MSFNQFVGESGLKVLSMARLGQCEYSIMLYLLNCSASGLDELVTNEKELSSLIGYPLNVIQEGISTLVERNIVRIRVGENSNVASERQSIRLSIRYDINTWQFDFDRDVTSHDAVVFPFRRDSNLQLSPMTFSAARA